ncbi:hypothetical protein, partial [Micromonospora chalcea]|uniref:hypothetical protein n=1 Tax=Micromonospora chalcea TaxID=1874 RepID=UPI003F4A7246
MQPERAAGGRPVEVKDVTLDSTASAAVPDAARQPIVSERRTAQLDSIMLDGTTGASDHAERHSITLAAGSGHFPPVTFLIVPSRGPSVARPGMTSCPCRFDDPV